MGVNRLLLIVLLLGMVYPYVVVNSQDALDVSSAVFYANVKGEQVHVIMPGTTIMTNVNLVGRPGNILLVESPSAPMVAGLKGSLEEKGNAVEVLSSTGTALNLELAKRSGSKKLIFSDPYYGYNVVVIIPYAKETGAYMIFASRNNTAEISSFLSQNRPEYILRYGSLDDEVKDMAAATGARTETIDNGDRYQDNMQLLNKYYSIRPERNDVLFADGSALEASIISGNIPVVLVSTIIPSELYSFLFQKVQSGQIKAGTLLGTDNVNSVYNMKKHMETEMGEKKLAVFVKFGQAASSGGEPQPLSMFPLPVPYARISIVSASYNPSLGALELIYENTGNARAYVKSSIAVLSNGQQVATVGDPDSYVVNRGERKGTRYPLSNPGEGQLSINDTTFYGISINALDKGFVKYMDVGRISFVDKSSMALSDASYSQMDDALTFKVRNNGTEDAFYRIKVEYANDEGITVYEEDRLHNLSSGRNEILTMSGVIQLPAGQLSNTNMNVTAVYGAREAFLDKETTADVKMESFPWWILLALLIIILAIAYWYYRKRRGEAVPAKKKE